MSTRVVIDHRPPPTRSRLPFVAAAWSLAIAAVGAWWLVVPGHYAGPSSAMGDSLVGLVEPTLVSGLMLALGIVGVVVALLGTEGGIAPPAPWVAAPAVALALVFGFLVPDLGLLVGLGYSAALIGVPAAVVLTVVLAVRHRGLRPAAAGVVAAGVIAVIGFGLDARDLGTIVSEIGSKLPAYLLSQALPLLAFAGGVVWLGMAGRAVGVTLVGSQPAPWTTPVRDRGWWITVAAVVCPLLFAAQRMSWLTPWPLALDAHDLETNPGLRAFGVAIGVAAALGGLLTWGLISRWGAVYPRWFPGIGGRPVSPIWPGALAATVGALVTVAGRSLGQFALFADRGNSDDSVLIGMAVLFVVWGPLLIASAVAYVIRRTTPEKESA